MSGDEKLSLVRLKIELLELTKPFIVDSEPWAGICPALQWANLTLLSRGVTAAESDRMQVATDELRGYVQRSLMPWAYLSIWQKENMPQKYTKGFGPGADPSDVRAACKQLANDRRAWIDWIIACLKEDNGID